VRRCAHTIGSSSTTTTLTKAPTSAADAAAIILDGVRSGGWRILVGEDAKKLDAAVRANPEAAYDYTQLPNMPDIPGGGAPEG
jgi:hypothetical protein